MCIYPIYTVMHDLSKINILHEYFITYLMNPPNARITFIISTVISTHISL